MKWIPDPTFAKAMADRQVWNDNGGFIALMSVIIISAILIILVAIVSASTFYTRFNILDYENKKISAALAEGCAETAMAKLVADPAYDPGTTSGDPIILETNKSCKICDVSGTGPFTIITRASYGPTSNNKAFTNLTVNVTPGASNFIVNSWDEFPSYSGSCALP